VLTVGSLFSGIGGLELGLEWAGLGPVLWQVESDQFCRQVLAKHWPEVTRHDDVRTVGAGNLEPVDLICGGFPCQDLSCAGKQLGFAGARSGLWSEFARIVRELRPAFVVVENVPGLLARGRLGVVLGDLAACGYDATWDCIPAAAVGAPHRRDRVFIVAHAAQLLSDGSDHHAGCHSESGGQISKPRDDGGSADVADPELYGHNRTQKGPEQDGAEGALGQGHEHGKPMRGSAPTRDEWRQWESEPNVGRVADGIPARVDRLRSLGNAVVPQCAEVVGWVVRMLAGLEGT
jgi:DNA (cytosine-5)-methyltransferase 1